MILVAAVEIAPAFPYKNSITSLLFLQCVVDTGLSFSFFQLKFAQLENRKQFLSEPHAPLWVLGPKQKKTRERAK